MNEEVKKIHYFYVALGFTLVLFAEPIMEALL